MFCVCFVCAVVFVCVFGARCSVACVFFVFVFVIVRALLVCVFGVVGFYVWFGCVFVP